MIVVKPTLIDDSSLTSSTIAEPDTGETVWAAYTSTIGDRRINITTHRIYEAVIASTDDPIVGVTKNPATWVDVAPTNKWAMFDAVNNTVSTEATSLVVEIDAANYIDSVAGFLISGVESINVTVNDPVDGEVYNVDVAMVDDSQVVDLYTYYYSPFININKFALYDLPPYFNATITVTFTGTDISVGNLQVGNRIELGTATMGSSRQLLDYSRFEEDTFGTLTVTPGRKAKLINYDVTIPIASSDYVYDTISSLTGIPSVWSATDDVNDPRLVFGYYRDHLETFTNPSVVFTTIQVQGII